MSSARGGDLVFLAVGGAQRGPSQARKMHKSPWMAYLADLWIYAMESMI